MLDNGDADADQAVAARLKRARIDAGYASASEFARNISVNITTYHHHENGRRGVDHDYALLYARALNIATGTLLYGEELRPVTSVPIVGTIGMGGKIQPMDSDLGSLERVALDTTSRSESQTISSESISLPEISQLQALRISGDALYPAYRHEDLVLYRRLIREPQIARKIHGLECIVELTDGSRLLRQVILQPDGLATLIAYSAPPMINVEIVAAAPVEMVLRNRITRAAA